MDLNYIRIFEVEDSTVEWAERVIEQRESRLPMEGMKARVTSCNPLGE